MKNIDIKKAIESAVKRVDNYKIEVIVWHGDGTFEGRNAVYGLVSVWNTDSSKLIDVEPDFGEDGTEETESEKALRAEQKKVYNYLRKQFINVSMKDCNV